MFGITDVFDDCWTVGQETDVGGLDVCDKELSPETMPLSADKDNSDSGNGVEPTDCVCGGGNVAGVGGITPGGTVPEGAIDRTIGPPFAVPPPLAIALATPFKIS